MYMRKYLRYADSSVSLTHNMIIMLIFSSICKANLSVQSHVISTQCRRFGRPGGN